MQDELLQRALRLLEPWRWLTRPRFYGIDDVPDERPLLFVGNHTLYGMLDVPLLYAELYREKGIFLRALGDHIHFKIPGWRDALEAFGVVDGTRENCAELMRAGESILVFPGGAREVAKRRGEKYKLVWKERLGFARMAIENGCTIVPFSAVGLEDAYDIVMDADELLATPLGALFRRFGLREDALLPVVKGIGPTPLPRPQRLYFRLGPAVPTAGLEADEASCRELRDRVKAEVERGIELMLVEQAADPDRVRLPGIFGRDEAL